MNEKRNSLVGGLILVTIGVLALIGQFANVNLGNLPLYFVAGLGGLFLLWGLFTREGGLMIPGGILSGIGWGIVLITGPYAEATGTVQGGIFMLSFAAGWAIITLLTALFADETHWWALIPGSIMALIGMALLYEGVFADALALLGKIWPVFLIIAGISVLFSLRRKSEKEPKSALEQ